MKIKFDFEGRDEEAAFFALYSGLRMYKEFKEKQVKLQREVANGRGEEAFSTPAAEAYLMLEDLREKFPSQYEEAKVEYNEVYGNINQ